MATTFNLKLTNKGKDTLIQDGALETFKFFSINDTRFRYDVTANDDYITELMNLTGSREIYTARKSCTFATETSADIIPPTSEQEDEINERIKLQFYKTECGAGDFNKLNLDVTVNLAEWFAYLETLVTTEYSQSALASLTIFEGIDAILESYDVVDGTWDRVDNNEKFTSWFEFASDVDRVNYKNLVSRYVEFTDGVRNQVDNSFNRFYSPFVFDFSRRFIGNDYIEGSPLILTFHPPQFGYVINGLTNFINISSLKDPSNYKTITPAVRINDRVDGIYYLSEPKSFNTQDPNGFIASAIWGYVNSSGERLISGLVELMKNTIETKFKETSFNRYELPINLNLKTSINNSRKFVGGKFNINFIYDTNLVTTGLYNNIVTTQ